MIFLLIVITVIIGTLMPVQAGINAELTRLMKHPYLGAFISFFTGTVVLSIMCVFHGQGLSEIKKLSSVPPYMFLGGVLGALFVGSSIFLIPRLGATTMIAAFVTGQLLMSVVIDHYGMMGLPSYQVTPLRIVGILLLFAGLFLVIRKT